MPPTDPGKIDTLIDGVRELTGAVSQLELGRRRNLFLIRVLGLSLGIDIVLSGLLGFVAFNAHDASVRASHATSIASTNRQTLIASCRAGNDAREQNRQLWLFILDLAREANPHPTPAERKWRDSFQDRITATFALRDCDRLGPNGVPTLPPSPSPPGPR